MSTINAERATTVKSGLAKLLAMENISIRHVMGTVTASFDVKARVLRLPVWRGISEDLYDMLVVHEVGHALYTPEAEWMAAIKVLSEKHNPKPGDSRALAKTVRSIHAFCNIVEDVRIDIKQRKRYPGSKRNYIIGYAELFERDFFGLKKRPINQMTFINRLNVYSKAGFSNVIIVPFTDEEKTYVKRTQETETFQDVLELAEELWLLAQRRGEAGEGEGDGEGESDNESEQDETQEMGPGSEESEGENSEDESEDSDETPEDGAGETGEGEETEEEGEGEGADSDESSEGETKESEDEKSDGAGEGESDDSEGEDSGEGDSDEKPKDEPLIPPEAREALDAESFEKAKEEAEKQKKNKKEKKPKQNTGNFGSVTAGKSKDEQENPEDYLPEAETDEAFKNSVDGLAADNGVSYYYSTIPELTGEPWTDFKVYLEENRDYISKSAIAGRPINFSGHQRYLNAFKVEENKTISFMVKEFEMRKSATAYQKSMAAKTGVIDTNKLHSYIYNDDIFKRNTVVPKGKNHGFVMFIDWSGSMSSNILNTTRQLLSLCLFCKRIAVPFEVFTFTSASYLSRQQQKKTGVGFVKTSESLQMEADAHIRNILSSRMNVSQLNEAMVLLVAMARTYNIGYNDRDTNDSYMPDYDQMGGTPLNETILIAEKIVKKFQSQSKVEVTNVIFLTDGEGSPPALGSNQYNMHARRYSILIQDPKTRHEYILPEINRNAGRYGNTAFDWTNALLSVLKDRTNCNLVGFYLYDRGGSWGNIVFQGKTYDNSDEQKYRKIWREDGYAPIQNSGYDEYYLVSAKAMELDQGEFAITSKVGQKVTANRIATAFLKHMDKKSTNRLLLSNFIKRIT